MYNINMGSLFSQNGGTEDNTLITADFATEKDEGNYGGSVAKGLNNNILNILNSEVVRNDFSDTNINNRISKILNSVSEINGGSNRYLKYDIFNVIKDIEEAKKGGAEESSEINFSESSQMDMQNKISNMIRGGGVQTNDDLVKQVLEEELNQRGGDCNCDKEQKGGYHSSSSSMTSSSTSSSSSNYSESSGSSSSEDEEFRRKKYESDYTFRDSASVDKKKKSKKSNRVNKVSRESKENKIKKMNTSKKSKKNNRYGGDSTSNNSNSDFKNSASIGKGISIFPFNSSSVMQSSVSEKNFRALRRHI